MSDAKPTGASSSGSGMPSSGPVHGRFEVRVTADSHFGWIRTRLSVERTLLSWVRTAVSLIGFGFGIVQFFARVQEMPGAVPARFPDAPRYLGLAMIFSGVLALVVSIWDYQWTLRYLWGGDFTPIAGMTQEIRQTPILAVAGLLILIGIFAFVAVLFRLL
jgi:putative membrane protein